MKNKFRLHFYLVPLTLLFAYCQKDKHIVQDESPELRLHFVEYTLPAGAFLSVQEGRKALAAAISAEMLENPAFRTALYEALSPNQSHYKEAIIGLFQDRQVSRSESGGGLVSVKTLLNTRLRQLDIFNGVSDPLGQLLDQDKLVSVWFPNEFLRSLGNKAFDDFLPLIVSDGVTQHLFVGNQAASSSAPIEILAMYLSEAQASLLYHEGTKRYAPYSIPFEEKHGFGPDLCSELARHLAALPDYPLAPGYKLVHLIEDVQNICEGDASDVSLPADPYAMSATMDRSGPEDDKCARAEYELKIKDNYSKHGNHIIGFQFNSAEVFNNMKDSACQGATFANVMELRLVWLQAENGKVRDFLQTCHMHYYVTDLVKTSYSFDTVSVRTLPWKAPKLIRFKRTTVEPVYVQMPGSEPFALFSSAAYKNHWRIESNGDAVFFRFFSLQQFGCPNSPGEPRRNFTIPVGGSYNFQKLSKGPDGQAQFEFLYTVEKTIDYNFHAVSMQDLGGISVAYCQPYWPWPSKPFHMSQGDQVTFYFYAPWY